MSTLKTTNLQHTSAASPAIVLAADGSATAALSSLNGGPLAGSRNRIINGDMRIDQRNAGASVTPTSTVADTYSLDRWCTYGSAASKFSVQQNAGSVTPPSGFQNYIGITSLAATSVGSSDQYYLAQFVEGFNTAGLALGTASAASLTLSFWVRSSLTGTFGGSITNSAINRSYPFTYSISAANTWEQKTVTLTGDTTGTWLTTNGVGMRVHFGLGVGSTFSGTAGSWAGSAFISATGSTSVVATNGATFYITGVQLEAGTVATPFERRSYGQELALCQRYYQKNGQAATSAFALTKLRESDRQRGVALQFPVTMRAAPSIAIVDSDKDGSTNNFSVTAASTGGAKVTLLATADTQSPSIQIYTAEIEL